MDMNKIESDLMHLLSKTEKTIDDALAISQLTLIIAQNKKAGEKK